MRMLAAAVSVAACMSGCADPDSAVGFDEPAPPARFRAIHRAAATDDKSSISNLIQMLDSDDPAERVLAIGTLRRLTGETMGYDASDPPATRDAAVARWVEWYAQQGRTHSQDSLGASPRGSVRENGT